MMGEMIKKYALSGSAITLAVAMGLQTFFFGNSDLAALKKEVTELSVRLDSLESRRK